MTDERDHHDEEDEEPEEETEPVEQRTSPAPPTEAIILKSSD